MRKFHLFISNLIKHILKQMSETGENKSELDENVYAKREHIKLTILQHLDLYRLNFIGLMKDSRF